MDDQIKRVVIALCDDVGTPRANLVKGHVLKGEWIELQQLKCVPSDYTDPEEYFKDALVTELLRKCDLDTGVDKMKAAVDTFFVCERRCAATNVRLDRYINNGPFDPEDMPVMDFICSWRKEVERIVGCLPEWLTPRFSQGATYANSGLKTTIPDKMSEALTYYGNSECLLSFWERTAWADAFKESSGLSYRGPQVVRGNVFFGVPKDGTKFRGCAKEASINVGLQLDIGAFYKERLKQRASIDLYHGQEENRLLAQLGSITGSLTTIDLSNASDTVSSGLVKLLLPESHYLLLNSLRAPLTRVNGVWHRLEKFSSMGNGFTFELETIIFASLARTIAALSGSDPDRVRCYGDDIIVDTNLGAALISALRFFGFEPNAKKTFAEGPFRESCGGDYWSGLPVRAAYLEELPDEPQHWIALANSLRRVAPPDGDLPHRWLLVRRAWLLCLAALPSDIRRCRGPSTLGDVVIHDIESEWRWLVPRSRRQLSLFKCDIVLEEWDATWDQQWLMAYVPVPLVLPWDHWKPAVQYHCTSLGMPSNGVSPRDSVKGYRLRPIPARVGTSWTPSSLMS